MSALIVLLILFFWAYIAIKVSFYIANWLSEEWWRNVILILLFLTILPLPLVDEIIAKKQFERLCKENEFINIDREKAVGKTVYLDSKPEIIIQGTSIPIAIHQWRFIEENTKELVVSYNTLRADGGILQRMLGVPPSDGPVTFESTCRPKEHPSSVEAFKELGIHYIEPPIKQIGEQK
ncbi:hypothetical protein ACFQNF_16465 [Iodobacter arcticus]|uniref:Uncharacterized protein n=1 Tax=Iodobacter arcticus TaxID=590593 RepID=A0ABW2R2G5_9NEIS